jgi:predicted PolB exonuclease-like 3'-5' exonuclease
VLGAPHIGERSEGKLISDFIEKIGQLLPQLVTFNGQSFDLPVLRYRAMVNRVWAGGLEVRRFFRRYTNDALDLCDALGSYVPSAKVGLDEISKILGRTGNPDGRSWLNGRRNQNDFLHWAWPGNRSLCRLRSRSFGRALGQTAKRKLS